MKSVTNWSKNNIVAIILVLCFIPIYVFSQITGTAFEHWGSTSMEYLNSEYFRWLTCIFLFILCGILAEIACSIIMSYSEPVYGGGSSGGIFALIAVFTVCYLRFPQNFTLKWYRLDVIIVIAFFILANDNMGSFMTHIFGFVAGIIVSFVMVLAGWINNKKQKSIEG